MFNKEFCDKVEEIRLGAIKDPSYMLSVIKGSQEAVEAESLRKKAIADEIMKEKYKTMYDENSTFGQMLSSSGSKISEEELEIVMETIEANFPKAEFKSRDVLPLLPKINGEPCLNNRKLPSRLKKLAEFGKIEEVPNTKPKSYKLAE